MHFISNPNEQMFWMIAHSVHAFGSLDRLFTQSKVNGECQEYDKTFIYEFWHTHKNAVTANEREMQKKYEFDA